MSEEIKLLTKRFRAPYDAAREAYDALVKERSALCVEDTPQLKASKTLLNRRVEGARAELYRLMRSLPEAEQSYLLGEECHVLMHSQGKELGSKRRRLVWFEPDNLFLVQVEYNSPFNPARVTVDFESMTNEELEAIANFKPPASEPGAVSQD